MASLPAPIPTVMDDTPVKNESDYAMPFSDDRVKVEGDEPMEMAAKRKDEEEIVDLREIPGKGEVEEGKVGPSEMVARVENGESKDIARVVMVHAEDGEGENYSREKIIKVNNVESGNVSREFATIEPTKSSEHRRPCKEESEGMIIKAEDDDSRDTSRDMIIRGATSGIELHDPLDDRKPFIQKESKDGPDASHFNPASNKANRKFDTKSSKSSRQYTVFTLEQRHRLLEAYKQLSGRASPGTYNKLAEEIGITPKQVRRWMTAERSMLHLPSYFSSGQDLHTPKSNTLDDTSYSESNTNESNVSSDTEPPDPISRKKAVFTLAQRLHLRDAQQRFPCPVTESDCTKVAKEIGLLPMQVRRWFWNEAQGQHVPGYFEEPNSDEQVARPVDEFPHSKSFPDDTIALTDFTSSRESSKKLALTIKQKHQLLQAYEQLSGPINESTYLRLATEIGISVFQVRYWIGTQGRGQYSSSCYEKEPVLNATNVSANLEPPGRASFTLLQKRQLRDEYKKLTRPISQSTCKRIGEDIGISAIQVRTWFGVEDRKPHTPAYYEEDSGKHGSETQGFTLLQRRQLRDAFKQLSYPVSKGDYQKIAEETGLASYQVQRWMNKEKHFPHSSAYYDGLRPSKRPLGSTSGHVEKLNAPGRKRDNSKLDQGSFARDDMDDDEYDTFNGSTKHQLHKRLKLEHKSEPEDLHVEMKDVKPWTGNGSDDDSGTETISKVKLKKSSSLKQEDDILDEKYVNMKHGLRRSLRLKPKLEIKEELDEVIKDVKPWTGEMGSHNVVNAEMVGSEKLEDGSLSRLETVNEENGDMERTKNEEEIAEKIKYLEAAIRGSGRSH